MECGLANKSGIAAIFYDGLAEIHIETKECYRTSEIFAPKSHLAAIPKLASVARIAEKHAQPGIWGLPSVTSAFLWRLGFGTGQEVFRVAVADDEPQIVDLLHALSEALLQSITESLTSLSAANELENQTLGREVGVLLLAQQTIPCGQCQGEDMASTVEPFDPADAREWQGEAIARGPCPMCLSSPIS